MSKKIDNIVRHAEVSEKAIERYLAACVKELGGICLKYANAYIYSIRVLYTCFYMYISMYYVIYPFIIFFPFIPFTYIVIY